MEVGGGYDSVCASARLSDTLARTVGTLCTFSVTYEASCCEPLTGNSLPRRTWPLVELCWTGPGGIYLYLKGAPHPLQRLASHFRVYLFRYFSGSRFFWIEQPQRSWDGVSCSILEFRCSLWASHHIRLSRATSEYSMFSSIWFMGAFISSITVPARFECFRDLNERPT